MHHNEGVEEVEHGKYYSMHGQKSTTVFTGGSQDLNSVLFVVWGLVVGYL